MGKETVPRVGTQQIFPQPLPLKVELMLVPKGLDAMIRIMFHTPNGTMYYFFDPDSMDDLSKQCGEAARLARMRKLGVVNENTN